MKRTTDFRVLGIDPGTAACGFGVVTTSSARQATLVECGVIKTSPADKLPSRLHLIFDAVNELIERHQPEVLAVESVFFGRNARSALVLGQARGVVILAAERAGIPVEDITPAEVKRAIAGNGRASKEEVAAMVTRLLRLRSAPKPSDAADGVAIALTQLLRVQPSTLLAGGASR